LILVNSSNGSSVIVSVDGHFIDSYSLSSDGEYSIDGINGISDILCIEAGSAFMKDAACPDKLCVKQGRINRSGESIVCLPGRIVVVVESDTGSEVDSIAQ